MCYNSDVSKLSKRDKLISLIGTDDKEFASTLSKGDDIMSEIFKEVKDFCYDDEIVGAYDIEHHRQILERTIHSEGFNEGSAQKTDEIIKRMLEQNIDVNVISSITEKDIDYIYSLK